MINWQRFRVGLVLVALSGLPVGAGCSVKISDGVVTRISTTEATKRHGGNKALFLDARPNPAYAKGHIAGAINLRLSDVSYADRDPRLLGRSPLIVYGENPGSAPAIALAKRLLDLEYDGIVFYEPGFAGWRNAGLPVERSGD